MTPDPLDAMRAYAAHVTRCDRLRLTAVTDATTRIEALRRAG